MGKTSTFEDAVLYIFIYLFIFYSFDTCLGPNIFVQ